MKVTMMSWIKKLRLAGTTLLNDHQSFSALPVEAIILENHVTGNQKQDLMEIRLLLQVFPRTGRNYIISHCAFLTESDRSQYLQVGQKIMLYQSRLQNKVRLIIGLQ